MVKNGKGFRKLGLDIRTTDLILERAADVIVEFTAIGIADELTHRNLPVLVADASQKMDGARQSVELLQHHKAETENSRTGSGVCCTDIATDIAYIVRRQCRKKNRGQQVR